MADVSKIIGVSGSDIVKVSGVDAGNVTKIAGSIDWPHGPTTVGEFWNGGYFFKNTGTHYLICAPDQPLSGYFWKTSSTDTTGTSYYSDGFANTEAMVIAGITDHPAGEYCVNYSNGGYNDWYLPAYEELNWLMQNHAALETAGADSFYDTHYYWCSTQYSATDGYAINTSELYTIAPKSSYNYYVRPIRREAV
jgi:hypothetical protein